MLHRVPSIEKVRAAIGWEPTQSLDEILRDVVDEQRLALGEAAAVADER
jgi:nucleoside-diphosphate-sugar epimerase